MSSDRETRSLHAELLRAVQQLVHAVDLEPYLARGLEGSLRSLGTLIAHEAGGSAARRSLARVDADLGLVACRVGLCREVVGALRALHELGVHLHGAHGLPAWNLDAAPTWDPQVEEAKDPARGRGRSAAS